MVVVEQCRLLAAEPYGQFAEGFVGAQPHGERHGVDEQAHQVSGAR